LAGKNNNFWLGKVWNMADNLGRGVGWILGAGRFLMGWIYGVWGSWGLGLFQFLNLQGL